MNFKAWNDKEFENLQIKVADQIVSKVNTEELLHGVFLKLFEKCKKQIDEHIAIANPALLHNYEIAHQNILNAIEKMRDEADHMEKFSNEKAFAQALEDIKKKIDEHIAIANPDLLNNFNMIYNEVSRMTKDLAKSVDIMEKRAKKVFDSSSMAEDVFKMRDEMKELRKKMDKFNQGIRGLAKLKVFDDKED